MAATFKDDGYSGFKEVTRDGFGELIAAIETRAVDVAIVRDIDRLTCNLTDWNAFEKGCVRHGVRLSAYTGGDLDLSTPEGAYYGRMETRRAKRESAVKSARVREAHERNACKGRRPAAGSAGSVYEDLRQSQGTRPQEAQDSPRGNQLGRSGRDQGRGHAGAGARGIGRVDRAGLDRAGHQASRREEMLADVDCRHADLGAARGASGVAGQEVPDHAMAGDH